MTLEDLRIRVKVMHPQYGEGTVKSIGEHTAEILFGDGLKTVDPVAAELRFSEPQVSIGGVGKSLPEFLSTTVREVLKALGVESVDETVDGLHRRWLKGTMLLRTEDGGVQPKEIPIEVFFHKIVMLRNNLRVLEQKINAHPGLSDAEKVELQQYVTRSYGSLTTFNILFRDKEDHFKGAAK